MSRLHAERDKAVSDVEKVREELERCQSTLGKLQLQQEKTQQGYDKAQNEVDRLQERLDKTLAESRKVNRSALSSFYRFLSDNFFLFPIVVVVVCWGGGGLSIWFPSTPLSLMILIARSVPEREGEVRLRL